MNTSLPGGLHAMVMGAYAHLQLNHGAHYLAKFAHDRANLPGLVLMPDWGLEEDLPGESGDRYLDNQWCLVDTTAEYVRTFATFTQAKAWATANLEGVAAWGQIAGSQVAWYPEQVVAWTNDALREAITCRTAWSSQATMTALHHQLGELGIRVPARSVNGGWRLEVDDENTDTTLRVFIPYGTYGEPGVAHITRHAYPSEELTGTWELADPYAAAYLIHRSTQGPYTPEELADLAAHAAAVDVDAVLGTTTPIPTGPGVCAPGQSAPAPATEGASL